MAPPHRSRELNTDSACVQKTGGGLIDKQTTQEREEPVWPQAASAEGNSSSNCGVILSHSEDPGEQGERGDTLLGEQLSATAWIPRGPPSDSQLW
ncbi:unnamed protein product [Gadus morhua 'NCC']